MADILLLFAAGIGAGILVFMAEIVGGSGSRRGVLAIESLAVGARPGR